MRPAKFIFIAGIILVTFVLVLKMSPTGPPPTKEQLFLETAMNGDKKQLEKLLAEGINPNYQGETCGSALLFAAANGHLEIVKALIEKGANINIQNEFSRTPLMASAARGHDEIVLFLLEKGADISLTDMVGESAYKNAIRYDQLTTARLIARYCPNKKCE